MEGKCPDETLRTGIPRMTMNLCILYMLEDTFSFGAAHTLIVCLRAGILAFLSLFIYFSVPVFNPFNPEFLTWTFTSLYLDTSFVSNSVSTEN